VEQVLELLTMALGPESLLVAARIDLAARLDSDQIEALSTHIDRDMREAVPSVSEVFLDPTPRHEIEADRERARLARERG
jgi:divalent metal cation (Fe/Co/Zn/Cd) transporter